MDKLLHKILTGDEGEEEYFEALRKAKRQRELQERSIGRQQKSRKDWARTMPSPDVAHLPVPGEELPAWTKRIPESSLKAIQKESKRVKGRKALDEQLYGQQQRIRKK